MCTAQMHEIGVISAKSFAICYSAVTVERFGSFAYIQMIINKNCYRNMMKTIYFMEKQRHTRIQKRVHSKYKLIC